MRISIKTKSNLFLAGLLLLTVSMLSFLVLKEVKKEQQKHYEDQLSQQAKVANIYIRQAYALESGLESRIFLKNNGEKIAKQLENLSGMQVILYDMNGDEIGNSFPLDSNNHVTNSVSYALKNKVAYEVNGDEIYYSSPVLDGENQIAVVEFIYLLNDNNEFINKILLIFLYIGGFVFLISFIIGSSYFNSMVHDILKLKGHIEAIKIGEFKNIGVIKRNDELKELEQGICFMNIRIEEIIKAMEIEQEKLKVTVEKLQILEQQQKRFIENVTHEFKTPLTIIRAYVDLIEMYTDDPKLMEDARSNIGNETLRLLEMVDKALYIYSLEKYDFEANGECIEVANLLKDISKRMEGKVKKFELSTHLDLNEAYIFADRESVTQIFVNIVDNAIKYNVPKGEIFISNYIEKENVSILIKDTGIGIPEEAKNKIFEAFYRVDKELSKQTNGVGLGLALVKELVERQNGKIQLESQEEKGTTFKISFPIFH